MPYCSNCGKEIIEVSKFCPHCGKPLASQYFVIDEDKEEIKRKLIILRDARVKEKRAEIFKNKSDVEILNEYIENDTELPKLYPGDEPIKYDLVMPENKYKDGGSLLRKFFVILSIFLLIYGIYMMTDSRKNSNRYFLGEAISISSIIPFVSYFLDKKSNEKKYERYLKEYKKELSEYNINKTYMENEYPKLKEEYDVKYNIFSDRFDEKKMEYANMVLAQREESKTAEKDAKDIYGKYGDIISSIYYDNLNEIIEIFERGRADSIKEAINVFENDRKSQELIDAQNRIREEERRHNLEMEENQREMITQQQEHQRRLEIAQMEANERMLSQAADAQKRAEIDAKRAKKDAEWRGEHQCMSCGRRLNCFNKASNLGNCGGFIPG